MLHAGWPGDGDGDRYVPPAGWGTDGDVYDPSADWGGDGDGDRYPTPVGWGDRPRAGWDSDGDGDGDDPPAGWIGDGDGDNPPAGLGGDGDGDGDVYDPPAGWIGDGDGDGDGDGKGAWTGQKRRRHRGPSSPDAARGETIGQEDHDEIARARDMDMIAPSDSPDELAELENDTISTEEFNSYVQVLLARPPPNTFGGGWMLDEQQREVYERLALYRVRASKLAQGVSRDELDDMTLRKEYSSDTLEDLHYFDHYDKADSVDWYFDPDYSMFNYLGDYNRLVLKNGEDGEMYLDWENYRSWFTSYEMDEEYIKYCEELSKKIKWIKRYMECARTSPVYIEMDSRAFRQAAKIAIDFPHINYDLAFTAYVEYIWNVSFDYWHREEIGHLLFEIWKRITKQKIAFRDAVDEVNRGDMFHRHKKYMQFYLDHSDYSSLKSTFDTCVEGIPDNAAEDDAHDLIVSAVWNKLHKDKTREKYIMRKMEIAKYIGLDPKV